MGHDGRVRGTSLATRFLLTLVATAVLPLASYGWLSLRGMREQIDEQVVRVFLPQLAADHADKIEAHFEKVDQACAVVREIARSALRRPAEIAEFEEQVELVPDLLDNFLDLLLLADGEGRVVYWRDGLRLDPSAHGLRAARVPSSVADEPWFRRAQDERGVQFAAWGRSPWLAAGVRALDPAGYHLGVALDVPQPQGKPAVLFALLRWAEVQRIVDEARGVLVERAQLPSAEVFLVGADGVVVAHTDRARYGSLAAPLGLADALHEARATGRGAFATADGNAWRLGSASLGRRERAFVLGIAVPEAELFAPSDAFARVWLLAIAASVAVLVLWSLWASRTIVRPVRALVAATRRVGRGDLAVKVAARGGPELGELATAFNQMADELAEGRRKLAGAEREQAWAEMARQVAHEVKNPLQPMRLAAELLQRARREGDARAEAIADRLARTVLEQTAQLDRIAGEFRAFAGVADAARAAVGIDDWLGELCERQRDLLAGKSIRIDALPGAAGVRVSIDRASMARVLGNLIHNALDAAPQGVHVTLATTVVGGEARLSVADDGPGIPADVRERIFEPYFTTKSSGTGLGLAICRRIVEAHGGRIELVESRPGRTAFCVALPTV
ncbi:MAG: hypothetical protein RL398_1975 [Planctomycetota bacterium]